MTSFRPGPTPGTCAHCGKPLEAHELDTAECPAEEFSDAREGGRLIELRTWEKFSDLRQRRHDTGRLSWDPKAIAGYQFRVWEGLASVGVGDSPDGVAMQVCADAFGTLVRRLVDDGAEVRPGQPIAEVSYRDPTLGEYEKVWREARAAEERIYELEHQHPLRAAWDAFRRRRR